MKSSKPRDHVQNVVSRILASNKFRYFVLLSIAYLISLTLTAQQVKPEDYSSLKTHSYHVTELPSPHHFLMKVQINPPSNQNLADYEGCPINILNSKNELIAEGFLDVRGRAEFNQLIRDSLRQVHIYSVATGDMATIDNPNMAVVGFLISSLEK